MKTEKEKKLLGVPELTCYGIGNSIGSGIFVSMGVSIGYTGHSITLALALACVVVLFAYGYKTIMAGMFALPGGRYSQAALLQPPLLVGVSALSTAFSGLAFAMYAISIVEYAATVVPQVAQYDKAIEIGILTLFFATTLLGDKFMGRFNLIMVVVLVFALLVYTVVGLTQVDWTTVSPVSDNYFYGGPVGLIMAIATMAFACQGATFPIDMTACAKQPKRSLPIAIMLASLIILVVYCLIGIVTAGILPVEDVAGKNLGVVAKEIFPYPVFVIFIIGGACFAIATSLYSTIAGVKYPLLATVDDGWLPGFIGIKSKKGYPWVLMLILYVTSILSIFVDLGLQDLISVMMIPTMILNTINNVIVVRLLKQYPKAWKKSFFHMPKPAFYLVVAFSTFCSLLITLALFTTLDAKGKVLILILVVGVFAWSGYRLKAKKVNLADIELAREEARRAAEEEEN